MIPQDFLNRASQIGLDMGLKLLQGFRLHPTDEGHVAALLSAMDISDGRWLDVGSGFGEFSRLAGMRRPGLKFTLLNYNEFQLAHSPRDMAAVRGDMHALPFADGSFDGAFFLYSLCHADDLMKVLSEARRVVRHGGSLVVYDYTGDSDQKRTWRELYAMFYPARLLEWVASCCGWRTDKWVHPRGEEIVFGNHSAFAGLRATLWKAVAV